MGRVLPTRSSPVRARRARLGGGLSADFWRLLGSAAAANLADGIAFIAIQLIAVRLGAAPAELAGIGIAQRLPMMALGLIAGGLADRADRRRTMVAIQIFRVAVIGTLAALAVTENLSILALVAAALALGVGEAFFDTNSQAIVPMVAGKERLVPANGRLYAIETLMGSFVGPPIGAFLVAISIAIALTSAAFAFALAAIGLALLAGTYRPEPTGRRRTLAVEIAEGVRFLGRHRLLATLTSMVALQHMGSAALLFLLPLYALAPGPMGLTEPEFGLLFVAFGAGSLVASFVTGTLVAWLGRAGVLRLATVVLGVGLLMPALTANVVVVGLSAFAVNAAFMAFGITNVSIRQAVTPPGLLGRVNATHRTVTYLAGLVGGVLAGAIGELVGLREAFAVGALIVMPGLLGGLVVTERAIERAEAAAGGPEGMTGRFVVDRT